VTNVETDRSQLSNMAEQARMEIGAETLAKALQYGTSMNIPLWCDDRRSSSQRGRSFNAWPLIEAA
jgi:hypothetical protein